MLQTKFTFNDNLEIELSSDEETVMISIKEKGDDESQAREGTLYPEEIDLLIATLNFYKTQLYKN
jgi:hypothetical protein